MFIGLNPSTADEVENDPTVRRCMQYAKDWGYGALYMTNIFAFRATLPQNMKAQFDPVGPENDSYLRKLATEAGVVVAAWGAHGSHKNRGNDVKSMLTGLHYLGLTKAGHPRHPLYLRKDLQPVPLRT